jgi:predicted deacylase
MNDVLRVGDLTVAPGHRAAGVQTIQGADQSLQVPLFVVNGSGEGPTLAVTGGIHGAEYASIEAALQLGRSLSPESLRGRVIVAPVANMPAFRARSIYICPLDGLNLNRVFPGNTAGTATEQLAHWLLQNVIRPADYFVDLHGGDLVEALVPFTIYHRSGDETVDRASLALAQVFGIEYVVCSETLGSTYSAAAQVGIPAILAESGGQGIWSPEAVSVLTDGVNRLMRHLGMLEGPAPDSRPTQTLSRFLWLRSEHDGYYYPEVAVGQTVSEGQQIGTVADYQGNTLQSATAPAPGRILFLVSSLAINKGDPLLAIGA